MAIIRATNGRAPFAEHLFRPAALQTDDYHDAVRRGRQVMADSRVVLCGLARNVAEVLPRTRARLEQTGQMFGDYRIFLYENDSEDSTAGQLANWSATN